MQHYRPLARDGWDIKLRIRFRHMRDMPFKKLQARTVTATILSFIDYSHNVIPILQVLSHVARAYIWNADGLPGFLVKINFFNPLK